AGHAWIGDGLAATAAMRTRLLHGEDAALHPHLAASLAGRAGLDLAVFGARPAARCARGQRRHLDPLLHAGHGILEIELHHVADIGATARAAPGAAATENIAEDVAEDVAHVAEAGARPATTAATAHAVFERSVSVGVVRAALAGVRQHLVGLLAL